MARKRSSGEGSIYQLPSGRWRGLVTVNSKRLSFVGNTKGEVASWIKKTANQVDNGLTYQSTKVTLGNYMAGWLVNIQSSIRPATFRNYTILVNHHIVPALRNVLMKDLTADRLQAVYNEWIVKGIGLHTIRKNHAILHHALRQAEQTGLIHRNTADLVRPPQIPHKEMQFWSESEANRFLLAARGDRLYALFHLAIVTGARQMELLGLKWQDLDWTRGTIHIERQLTRMGKGFAKLKTKSANRSIEIGSAMLAELREHAKRQDLERRIAGDDWQDMDLIFTNLKGGPVNHKTLVDHHFKPLAREAKLPVIRFHDLRHTAAAIMLSHGVPMFVASRRLGHARASITSDIYGHLIPGAETGIGQMMDDLVAPVAIPLEELAE